MAKNLQVRERLSTASAAITHGLIGLVRELVPVVSFFFVAFFLIFLMFRLFAEKYSVEFSVLGKAAVGALVLGKVILLVDWAQSGHRVGSHRPAIAIGIQTFSYGLVVIVLVVGERMFHAVREAGSLQGGISIVIANANLDRFLGIVLLYSLVVGSYLVLQEIDLAMGKGALLRLFFKPPLVDTDGNQSAKTKMLMK
jgi:hypothetical protein